MQPSKRHIPTVKSSSIIKKILNTILFHENKCISSVLFLCWSKREIFLVNRSWMECMLKQEKRRFFCMLSYSQLHNEIEKKKSARMKWSVAQLKFVPLRGSKWMNIAPVSVIVSYQLCCSRHFLLLFYSHKHGSNQINEL